MSNEIKRVPLQRLSVAEELLVVGVDGSMASARALAWAIQHAVEIGGRLLVVTAWPMHAPVFVHEVPGHFNIARWEAAEVQAAALARATAFLDLAQRPTIIGRLENVAPARALLDASGEAALLVIGTDRLSGDLGDPGWSLTARLQQEAVCPVLLVPSEEPAGVTNGRGPRSHRGETSGSRRRGRRPCSSRLKRKSAGTTCRTYRPEEEITMKAAPVTSFGAPLEIQERPVPGARTVLRDGPASGPRKDAR